MSLGQTAVRLSLILWRSGVVAVSVGFTEASQYRPCLDAVVPDAFHEDGHFVSERSEGTLMPGDAVVQSLADELRAFAANRSFGTILADPPWQFTNRTGKVAPEHRRLNRYGTLNLAEIKSLAVAELAAPTAHLYLWVPNALLPEGIAVLAAWGFTYKANLVWHKVRRDGGSDGRGVGFYFRNVTELLLFGVRGRNARTLAAGRRQVNLFATRKREHSRKPDEQYAIIEACSPGPYVELFGRGIRPSWSTWGNQADAGYEPTWKTYAHNSRSGTASKPAPLAVRGQHALFD